MTDLSTGPWSSAMRVVLRGAVRPPVLRTEILTLNAAPGVSAAGGRDALTVRSAVGVGDACAAATGGAAKTTARRAAARAVERMAASIVAGPLPRIGGFPAPSLTEGRRIEREPELRSRGHAEAKAEA